MKKILIIVVVAIILLTPLWSFLTWYFWPQQEKEILITESSSTQEHPALNWVLTHYKYGTSDLPDTEAGSSDTLEDLPDVIYYADRGDTSSPEIMKTGILKQMYRKRKLIIGEYKFQNITGDQQKQNDLEQLFGMKYTGWVGRYFPSLDSNAGYVSRELISRYREYTRQPYYYGKSAGIIITHSSGKILILEGNAHLEHPVPVINTSPGFQEQLGLPDFTDFTNWFVINEPINEGNIYSHYRIHTNETGDSLLQYHGLGNEFPAIIGDEDEDLRYYFCGNFSDYPVNQQLAKFKGIDLISFLFYDDESTDDQEFFWKFYRPLMENILSDYHPGTATKDRVISTVDSNMMNTTSTDALKMDSIHHDSDSTVRSMQSGIPDVETSSEIAQWYIVIASLASDGKAQKFLSRQNDAALKIYPVQQLNTFRIAYGPFTDLRNAQMQFDKVLKDHPDAWMVRF